jgi:hypothetical protein
VRRMTIRPGSGRISRLRKKM